MGSVAQRLLEYTFYRICGTKALGADLYGASVLGSVPQRLLESKFMEARCWDLWDNGFWSTHFLRLLHGDMGH